MAIDFNKFYIDNAKRFFPDIVATEFDFFKDDVRTICDTPTSSYDVAIFINSSYVMDDDEHIRILSQLKENNVKIIIDMTSTLIPYHKLPLFILYEIKLKCFAPHLDRGKFHGFMRTKQDFRNIYKNAGWTLKEETAVGSYNYVAILENNSA